MKNIVQVFGRKKTSIAVAVVKGPGNGFIRINGTSIDLIEPEILKYKVFEPLLLMGEAGFGDIDIRIRVKGGGYVSQIYAIRQAIARGIVKYFEKFVNETKREEIRNIFLNYDRSILVGDSRRNEPKKSGGKGARSKYQKSYR
ncbi:rps16 (nucleomorph) [Hemiselmis andersenii]|uniref:Rps16 n=1 Tax=Hemiselmis andersenii TaxID=464988 RepID=A9BKF1_HEMAN|nr:rps16 [Hemiselmis andersenii]ABW97984.1 rps16 [Hemiselmis andersenii]|mmetsp:Transcript_39404/g.92160  ORF Transcript_39404/g.92160 Transcript_39404/m.92160 type:complete len:143 (-) Transcript_39404:2200-2628(-)